MDNFHYPSHVSHKSTLFTIIIVTSRCLYMVIPLHTMYTNTNKQLQAVNGTQRKTMKNALYILRYVKRHLSDWSDIEQQKKIKPVCRVMLDWMKRHQESSQSVKNTKSLKYCSNFLKAFRANLTACLDLTIVIYENRDWFLLREPPHTLTSLLYNTWSIAWAIWFCAKEIFCM